MTFNNIKPDFPTKKTIEDGSDVYGFEICINDNFIYMPFLDGGASLFVVTVNKGLVWLDAGSITNDKLLLDYYHSEMSIGDNICITIKKLGFVSSPIRERYFKACDL